MKDRARTSIRLTLLALVALSLLPAPIPVAVAQEAVTAEIESVDGSGVSGLATVTASQSGGATVELRVTGPTPGARYRAQIQAGSCVTPSASFGALGTMQVDASGEATLSANSSRISASGASTRLEYAGLADGDHIISIVGQGIEACGAIPRAKATLPQQPGPQFKLGFKTLAEYLPDVVRQPLEDEHYGPNGNSLQRTTTGLMVWRKADNWTAFTDGSMTWINGPDGIRVRPNGERFDWEAQR